MNKILFTFFLLAGIAAQAQESDYQSILREGRVWVNHIDYYDSHYPETNRTITYSYELHGDSLLNGKSYKKCYMKAGEELPVCTDADYSTLKPYCSEPVALIREEDMKVYVFLCDDFPALGMTNEYEIECEYLAYDFARARNASYGEYIITQESVDGVLCNHYDPTGLGDEITVEMLESVGACGHSGTLLFPVWNTLTGFSYDLAALSCVLDDKGNIIYKSREYRTPVSAGVVDIRETVATDSRHYNLQGQAVDIKSAPAGIYIHNGKKIVVK